MNDGTVLEDLIAASAGGCPVCRRSAGAATRFIAVFAREGVNDPGIRAELRRSLGFCRAHAMEAAAQVGAPLALSMVHADLCGHVARTIDAHQLVGASGPCPACDVASQRERHDVQLLEGHLIANVCSDHPRRVRERLLPRGAAIHGALPVGALADALRAGLAEAGPQRAAYSDLRRRLDAVTSHYDYRFRSDPFDDFGATWEALALFSGTDPARRPP